MKDGPLIKKRFIHHPQYTQPANLKNRIICQLISSVKGRVKMYGHNESDDSVAFDGTKAEEIHIQYLADMHVSSFWTRVEALYKEFIEEHGLYCKEGDDEQNVIALKPGAADHFITDVPLKVHKK